MCAPELVTQVAIFIKELGNRTMPEQVRSVWWVVGMVMLTIAAFGWGFMAAGYAHAEQGWREGLLTASNGVPSAYRARARAWSDFVRNGLIQLPNCVAVFRYSFQQQIWLPILIVVLEVLAVAGGFAMKQVESALSEPRRRR